VAPRRPQRVEERLQQRQHGEQQRCHLDQEVAELEVSGNFSSAITERCTVGSTVQIMKIVQGTTQMTLPSAR